MLFGYELKKIWRRVSPLLVLIVLLITAVGTTALTALLFNHAPKTVDVSADYAALQTKIADWQTAYRDDFAKTFNMFYADYKIMNASTIDGIGLVGNYERAKQSFQTFYANYIGSQNHLADYLLVQKRYISEFNNIMLRLYQFFSAGYKTSEAIVSGLKFTNPAWEDANLQTILDNLFFIQLITDDDLTELTQFFTDYPAGRADYDYTAAYDYALNRFWLAVATASTYTGNLSQYEGFDDYRDVATSTQACQLAKYRLEHPNEDFAVPFAFGNIFNQTNQVSLFDFVFTNLEMAMIPVVLLVIIWAGAAFFTDNYHSTLIAPIAAGKRRSTIILTKMLAVMLFALGAILLLTSVYWIFGLLFFHAYISPNILYLLNSKTVLVMSAFSYFVLYILNLIFKLLPLIAICGLFSFAKTKPFVIVGLTVLIYALVVVANLCLGRFWFYQFVPLLGLDPIRYFGAHLLFAPMPSSYNLWYTFPVILAIIVILYWVLIRKFRKRDF